MIHGIEKYIATNIPVKTVFFNHLDWETKRLITKHKLQKQEANRRMKSSYDFLLAETMEGTSGAVCRDKILKYVSF